MSEQCADDTERERVGRLIFDVDLDQIAMGVLEDAVNQSVGFEAERQTGMRIDVFRTVDTGTNRD
jgi:hypothetical protein